MRLHRRFLGLIVLRALSVPLFSQPAPLAGFKDEGTFLLYVNEERVGTLKFKWREDGSFENEAVLSMAAEKKFAKLLRPLPVIDSDKAILGKENRYWRKWLEHPVNDAYWDQANFLDRLKGTDIPVFHQSGWFDGDGIGTKLNYLRMQEYGHANQKLVLGPWGHTDTATRRFGDRDFGPQALIDLQRDYLRWFDYWLKGVDNGITKEPLVSIFAMGSNTWLRGSVYPLPVTRFEKWYLASAGQANTSRGDGRLTAEAPLTDAASEASDKYAYDPGDPTPDPNYYEESEEGEKQVRSSAEKKKEREAYHNNKYPSHVLLPVIPQDQLAKSAALDIPLTASHP